MSVAIRPRLAPFGWSIALHAVIAGLLLVSFVLPVDEAPPQGLQIEAAIVNEAVLQAAKTQRKEDYREEERQIVLKRKEDARLAKIESEKQADEQRRLEAEQAEQQKEQAAAEAAVKQKAEAKAKQKAEAQVRAKAIAAQKKKAEDARLMAEREADLRARLAEEEQRTSSAYMGLKAQYVAMIQAHVERRWFKPPGTPAGSTCVAFVTQIPGGEVVGVRFGACGGGPAFRGSIEDAVRNASPLPAPPQPDLFDREVRLVFGQGDG